jgi:hypothetical protein
MLFDEILELSVELARLIGVKDPHSSFDQLCANGFGHFFPAGNNRRAKTPNDMFFVFKIDQELFPAAFHKSLPRSAQRI